MGGGRILPPAVMVMPFSTLRFLHGRLHGRSLGVSVPRAAGPRGSTATPAGSRANVAVYAPGVPHLEIAYQAPGGDWQVKTLPNVTPGRPPRHRGGHSRRFALRLPGHPRNTRPSRCPCPPRILTPTASSRCCWTPMAGPWTTSEELISPSVRMATTSTGARTARPRTRGATRSSTRPTSAGQTKLHPDVPEELQGTYAGMAHPAMIEHLIALGITAVQLLPVHFHVDEPHLQNLGLTNYWGYNTAAFFAPHPGYATGAAQAAGPQAVQDEFKGMVKLLHAAGLEVILDVVYNHTAEGGTDGPTLSFRGLGEDAVLPQRRPRQVRGHHRLRQQPELRRTPRGAAGAGLPAVLGDEFHIDGFRFDLAVTLCRNAANEFDPRHPFLVAIGRRSGAVRRQAHRRTLGRGLRRLADRPVPRRLGGLERPLPRRRAQLLARRPRRDRRRRPGRSGGPARGRALRLRRASSSPPAAPGSPR